MVYAQMVVMGQKPDDGGWDEGQWTSVRVIYLTANFRYRFRGWMLKR